MLFVRLAITLSAAAGAAIAQPMTVTQHPAGSYTTAISSSPSPYRIATFAGGGLPYTPVAAPNTALSGPVTLALDGSGNVYFVASNCVFEMTLAGVLTRLAGGTLESGYAGDGGAALDAQLGNPNGLAVDSSGRVYIADTLNNRVRMVTADGKIATIAGTGVAGFSGDGGPAAAAELSSPAGLATDVAGDLYIADEGNNRIRRIDPNGTISTVVGTGVAGFSGDGQAATSAELNAPYSVAIDLSGSLYIADFKNVRVRKVANGIITTVAGAGGLGFSGEGGFSPPAVGFTIHNPWQVAVDASGNLYIADAGNSRIRIVTPAGTINTVAGGGLFSYGGDGGPATQSSVNNPKGVAVDSSGRLYIADTGNNRVRVVTPDGTINTAAGGGLENGINDQALGLATTFSDPLALTTDKSGNVYVADWDVLRVRKIASDTTVTTFVGNGKVGSSGDGGSATGAEIWTPIALAADTLGDLYVADYYNNVVRKVGTDGRISTVIGENASAVTGGGQTYTLASLHQPNGIAISPSGDIYVADTYECVILKVSAAGVLSTFAGQAVVGCPYSVSEGVPATSVPLHYPNALAFDGAGNLYVNESGKRIRRISGGALTTVAGNGQPGYSGDGGPATLASLNGAAGIVVDSGGNLLIADSGNSVIRRVSPQGTISTVAGIGTAGYSGDGGDAAKAQLNAPFGVGVDAAGNVYVSDSGNNVIRVLIPLGEPILSGALQHQGEFVVGQNGTYLVTITNSGPAVTSGTVTMNAIVPAGLTLTVATGAGWTCVNGRCSRSDVLPAGSSYPPITLTLNVGTLAASQVLTQVLISGGGALATSTSEMTAVKAVPQPAVSPGGVVNAASFSGPAVPGSLASVFGNFLIQSEVSATTSPLPTTLSTVSMKIGNTPVPLIAVSGSQINVEIPWELAGSTQAAAVITANGATGPAQTISLAAYGPGIFSINQQGSGQGAILDSNYRLVDPSNPAVAGATALLIYCTGLGPVANQPASGSGAPANPPATTTAQPTVTVGGVPAQVLFSGLAPGFTGEYQVNVIVPPGAPSGDAVAVVLSIGGVVSNTVTIAVKSGL